MDFKHSCTSFFFNKKILFLKIIFLWHTVRGWTQQPSGFVTWWETQTWSEIFPLIFSGKDQPRPELVGIYKRKQECKKTRKHALDQENNQDIFFYLGRFLDRYRVFFLFFLIDFLVETRKRVFCFLTFLLSFINLFNSIKLFLVNNKSNLLTIFLIHFQLFIEWWSCNISFSQQCRFCLPYL